MKKLERLSILILSLHFPLVYSNAAISGKDHHEHRQEEHGRHEKSKKAIVETLNHGKKFRLTKEAIKTLQIATVKAQEKTQELFEIPLSCVVDYQNQTGIYLYQNDWFKFIEVQVVHKEKQVAIVRSTELSNGLAVVSVGVPLLRIAQLEASGQGGQGHVH